MMILLIIAAICICLYKPQIANKGEFFLDYCSKENTVKIQGIFVIMVFFRHLSEYLSDNTTSDHVFFMSEKIIGQMMVGGFLFLSGYGIMYSFIHKPNYINSFWKRFVKVLLPFDLAIFLFLLSNLIIGKSYSVWTIIFSFIGFYSVGNSCWYIFAVLIAYIIFYLCFKLIKNINVSIVFFSILSLVYCILIGFVKEDYWYSTFLCFAGGILFCKFKPNIDKHLQNKTAYYPVVITTGIFTAICNVLRYKWIVFYILGSLFFCFFVIILCMKLLPYKKNVVLEFLGKHTFSIYILQRLPMNIIRYYYPNGYNNFLFSCVSICITILLAIAFDWIIENIENKIIKI